MGCRLKSEDAVGTWRREAYQCCCDAAPVYSLPLPAFLLLSCRACLPVCSPSAPPGSLGMRSVTSPWSAAGQRARSRLPRPLRLMPRRSCRSWMRRWVGWRVCWVVQGACWLGWLAILLDLSTALPGPKF
jgi:hypothetical protein